MKSLPKQMLLSAIIGTLCVGFGSANTVTNYQMHPLTMGAEQYIQNASLDKSQFPQGMNTAYGSGLAFDGYEKDGNHLQHTPYNITNFTTSYLPV